jgi:hypothetical protein
MKSELQDADDADDEMLELINMMKNCLHSRYLSFSTCPGLFQAVRFSLILLKIS